MRTTALLPAALLAASTFASPLRRDVGSDGVQTDIEVVTNIVYISLGASEPFSTGCAEEAGPSSTSTSTSTSSTLAPSTTAAALTTTPSSSSTTVPSTTSLSSTTSTATSTPSTSAPALLPSAPAGAPACPQPLTVDTNGVPILINLLGPLTLGGCTYTSTVTSNPLTLISDSSILLPTTAASGAGDGSTAMFQPYSTAVSGAAVGEGATPTSTSIKALFTTPSAFASMEKSLTKITAAPTFGASLTQLSVLATASLSLGEAQQSALSLIY